MSSEVSGWVLSPSQSFNKKIACDAATGRARGGMGGGFPIELKYAFAFVAVCRYLLAIPPPVLVLRLERIKTASE